MMEDSDILTLGWGCEPASNLWPSSEEFVTLDVEAAVHKESHEYATLEVAKERDRQFYNACIEPEKLQDWDLIRLEEQAAVQAVHHSRLLPAPTPLLPAPLPVPPPALPPPPPVAVTEFYVDSGYPGYPGAHTVPTYTSHHLPSYPGVEQGGGYPSHHPHPAYQQAVHHPSFPYSPFPADPSKRHTVRSPVSGKFVGGRPVPGKRPEPLPKPERKRPGPKAKLKSEVETAKPAEEPEYDPEVIANAHLTMDEDFYVCSVCKMKFKQPGNARRHIVTVHRNEKPHDCLKCGAKFGRKDKLKTHMMRNHGFSADDIKAQFKHSGQGRQRSSILVNRDNRKSTESSNSSDTDDSNPLNLKTNGKRGGGRHLNSQKRKKS